VNVMFPKIKCICDGIGRCALQIKTDAVARHSSIVYGDFGGDRSSGAMPVGLVT